AVSNLFSVSKLKMLAKRERVESIKETGQRIECLLEEERSQRVDGSKLFELVHTFGRNVQLGTVGNQLKMTFKWTKKESEMDRYEFVADCLAGLENVNQATKEQDEKASATSEQKASI